MNMEKDKDNSETQVKLTASNLVFEIKPLNLNSFHFSRFFFSSGSMRKLKFTKSDNH